MEIKEGFVICDSDYKEKILRAKKGFKNYIFLTQEELMKKLSFEVSKKGILPVMKKYHCSYDLALEYLSKLHFIEDKSYQDAKLDSLVSIYRFLKQEKLLSIDELFLIRLKQFPLTFINPVDTKEYQTLKEKVSCYTTVYEAYIDQNNYQPCVYCLNTILEECLYVFNEIKKLLMSGISSNQIYVLNAGSEYTLLLKRLAKAYGVSMEFPSTKDIRSSSIGKSFLKHCGVLNSFDEIMKQLDSNDEIYYQILSIINDYGLSKESPKDCISLLESLMKKMKYVNKKYQEAVHLVSDTMLLEEDDYAFLMSFNLGSAPSIQKEKGFLTDQVLNALGCLTSYEQNELSMNKLKNQIKNTKNLCITYKNYAKTDAYYPSLLIQELGLKVIFPKVDYGYSKVEDELRLASLYDEYLKYGNYADDLKKYGLNHINYGGYNHTYKGISKTILENHFKDKPLKLAYSNVKLFFACPFSYYADRILGFNEFKPEMAARMGTFAHAVLEDSYNSDFDFNASVITHKVSNCTDAKDEFFFDQMTNVLKNLISFNQKHEALSKLTSIKREEHILIERDGYTFEGFIDKLMYYIDGKDVYAAIIDYKTGKDIISLDNMADGFHLQLPSYMYLLSNYEAFKDLNLHIIGIYLQKVNIVLFDTKSSIEDQMNKKFRLEGYTIADISLIPHFDPSYERSDYIKSLAYGKDGFRSYSKIYHPNQQKEIVSLVGNLLNQASKSILEGDYKIAPKIIRNKNESCQFCKYKDLCFVDFKDYVYLEYQPFERKADED
ncbi:MAG: PD-(D/E)XK nuclease family protein [Anaeroplasmataceae bacterium]|nr:PD-(D/E)XK nuclease family protein [Anaeroplasmataceae bacterium]